MENVGKVKPSENLTDQEVKQAFFEAKKWEAKLDEIKASKVKLDKEMVDLVVDPETTEALKKNLEKVARNMKERLEDLATADTERRLFSLTKSVNEASVYPPRLKEHPQKMSTSSWIRCLMFLRLIR